MTMTINQEDKPQIIEKILEFYRKGWGDYSRDTLLEQIKDVQSKPENTIELTKEQLINILLDDDRSMKNESAYLELKEELWELENINF